MRDSLTIGNEMVAIHALAIHLRSADNHIPVEVDPCHKMKSHNSWRPLFTPDLFEAQSGDLTDMMIEVVGPEDDSTVCQEDFSVEEFAPSLDPSSSSETNVSNATIEHSAWEKPSWTAPLRPLRREHQKPLLVWCKPDWTVHPNLRSTGLAVKSGVDLHGPITHVNQQNTAVDDDSSVEWKAPLVLESKKEFAWEKPAWTQGRLLLKAVDPVERRATERPSIAWEKPAWVLQSPLRSTQRGIVAKTKGDLQGPITHVPKKESFVRPLRATKQGVWLRQGVAIDRGLPTSVPLSVS